jgi:LacI family transcriptional regulator
MNGPMPDAVFGANDAVALGCMEVLQERGLRVPEDVSVVGFDDTLLARTALLATVRKPLRAIGHRAVQLLVERIEARRRDVLRHVPVNIATAADAGLPLGSVFAPN